MANFPALLFSGIPIWPLVLAFFICASFVVRSAPASVFHVEQRVADADDRNDGSEAKPWKTIGHAAAAAQAGDVVIIGNGVYRESVKITRSGTEKQPIRFEAAAAANVTITGADRFKSWNADPTKPGVFMTSWGYDFIGWNKSHTHPDDDFHILIGRCEQVFVNGQPLRQVLHHDDLARGTFFVDFGGKNLYAWSADNHKLSDEDLTVEACTRATLWECSGDYVITHGLRFRFAANMAQHGAANFSGKHDQVEDCIFERTNSSGATFAGEDIVVRHCIFCDNGQLGFGAEHAHRLSMIDCEVSRNNAKGFSRDWEAGGDKLVLCRGAVIEHSIFRDNHGSGIWFDIGNENCTVKNCLIDGNEDAGIFDEISIGLHATDNVIINNGLADTPGAWGAQGGICLSSSPHSVVERNLLVENREGFSFREADRTTPRIDEKPGSPEERIWNHDEQIRHNIFAYNRDVQLRGWFDINDERHWPTAMQERKQASSLEALKLDISDNIYATRPAQLLFQWGVAWKRNETFTSLDDVRHELAMEQRSIFQPLMFVNCVERDFRVYPMDRSAMSSCIPKGTIPSVKVGTLRPDDSQ